MHSVHVLILAALVLLPWISAYPGAAHDATPESAAAMSQADWPMYRGDAARTGARDGRGPANDPIELWRYQAEGGINSAPAVVGGVVFVGCECNQLLALDAATGAVLWQFATTDSVASSPAVANGIVYVGSSDGTLYAVDASDGSARWQFPGARADGSPAVVDGVVYTGGADGQMYALDATTGEERWAAPLGESASRSPAVADGMVFIGSSDGVLHAIDSASGEDRWQFTADVDGVLATTAVGNGTVYQAVISSSDPQFYALDAATGTERWRFSNDEPGGLFPPVVRDNLVITISEQGVIYAFEPTTGEEQWQVETGDTVHAPPALVGDVLYVASLDRSLAARAADNGDELWDFALNSDVEYGPTIVDGIAYLGSKAGSIYAIGSAEAPDSAGTPASAAVVHFAPDGTVLDTIRAFGPGPGHLIQPWGVALDAAGHVSVGDPGTCQVKACAADGTLVTEWRRKGSEPDACKCSACHSAQRERGVILTRERSRSDDAYVRGEHEIFRKLKNDTVCAMR